MGQVIAPFGIEGWLRLRVYTREVDALTSYPIWWIEREGVWQPHRLENASVADKGLRAKLHEISDRTAAQALRGCQIAISRADMPATAPGEFYCADLIGAEVDNLQAERLGTIESFIEAGPNQVLVVKGERERLIPAPAIRQVDLDARVVTVDWGSEY